LETNVFKVTAEPKKVRATRQTVNEFLDMLPAPGDRRVNSRNLASLTKAEKNGELRPPEWAYADCKETGKRYRVNGKHTSLVLAELPNDRLKEHRVVISGYKCDTLEDVAKLYGTFDSRQSARSPGDLNQAVAGSDQFLSSLPQYFRNCVVAGLGYRKFDLEGGSNSDRPGAIERSMLMLDEREFVEWASALLSTADNDRTFLRRAVVAAMYETFRVGGKAAATKFWTKVRDGSDPNTTSPSRVLQMYLVRHSISPNARSSRRNATPREMYCKCVLAWNADRKRTTTELKYFADSDLPKAV
jgi:hypothetical protein